MAALPMMITNAGMAAIVNAQLGGTDEVRIAEVGLTETPFVMAPTIDALPGEFRRIDTIAGQAVSENVIHLMMRDPEAIAYDVTGFGLYDTEGTLIAVHSAELDPILSKAVLATSLAALDIHFANDVAAVIELGDALFLNPPASETVAGVVKLADDAAADAGVDALTAMTPEQVARQFANRWATPAEAAAMLLGDRIVTPESLTGIFGARSMGVPGYFSILGFIIQWGTYSVAANSTTSPSFPTSFPNACYHADVNGGRNDTGAQDNNPHVQSTTSSGFTIFNATDTGPINGTWFAIGN
jgi:hypothetical protein